MASPIFGSYTLPGSIQTITDDVAARARTWEPAGVAGMGSNGGLLAAKRVSIQGIVGYTSVATRDAGWEAIKAGLPPGVTRALVVSAATPARQYQCEVEQLTRTLNPQFPWRVLYDVSFLVPSGVAVATTATTQTLTSSGGSVTSVVGTQDALPILTLSVSGFGASDDIILTNTTTNEAMTLRPTATGDIVINSDAETITRSAVDVSEEWRSGQFLSFEAGVANVLTVAVSGSATVSGLAISYQARWR